MAFSESPVTVRRMMPFISPLAEGRETTWRTDPGRSRWLAYRVREALFAARANAAEFPELAAANYVVEVLNSQEVRARRRASPAIQLAEASTSEPVRVQTQETIYAQQIMDDWEETKQSKLYYPTANLSPEELLLLHDWTSSRGLMFFENAGAITLMEEDTEMLEYAWNPSDLDKEWEDG